MWHDIAVLSRVGRQRMEPRVAQRKDREGVGNTLFPRMNVDVKDTPNGRRKSKGMVAERRKASRVYLLLL